MNGGGVSVAVGGALLPVVGVAADDEDVDDEDAVVGVAVVVGTRTRPAVVFSGASSSRLKKSSS